jgi:hypothetical protein
MPTDSTEALTAVPGLEAAAAATAAATAAGPEAVDVAGLIDEPTPEPARDSPVPTTVAAATAVGLVAAAAAAA